MPNISMVKEKRKKPWAAQASVHMYHLTSRLHDHKTTIFNSTTELSNTNHLLNLLEDKWNSAVILQNTDIKNSWNIEQQQQYG